MSEAKFSEIVKYTKLAQCHSCNSHEYRLPLQISPKIEKFMSPFGSMKFPLDRVKIIKVENEQVQISSRVGTNIIRIKFKKDPTQRQFFEVQLAAYLSEEMNVEVRV